MKMLRIHVAVCALVMGMSAPLQADVFTYKTFDVEGAEATMIYAKDGKRIVGTFYEASIGWRGFVADEDMGYDKFDVPGASITHAYGIDGNKIVGTYYDKGWHGFIHDSLSNTYTTLNAPGASDTYVYGINGNKIVGASVAPNPDMPSETKSTPFIYNGKTYTTFEDLLDHGTRFYDSDGGNILAGRPPENAMSGSSSFYDGQTDQWKWLHISDHSGMSLGDMQAYGLEDNKIVGTYSNTMSSEDLQIHGFLTYDFADDMASTTHTLDVPGAWETHPWDIAGNKIVGYYVDAAGYHGFVATPEPSMLPLLGSGLGATCCRRRRPRRPSGAGG